MTSECPYCRRLIHPGERVVFTTDCRLDGLSADGCSVAFDVDSRNTIVHRVCWEQMLVRRPVPMPTLPHETEPAETTECTSVRRTDALSFME